jgi:hypothetical protein
MKHISDEDLQAYLDGDTAIDTAEIEQHIKSCTVCQTALRAYQEVYHAIESEPVAELAADFSSKVVADIKGKLENKSQLQETLLLLAFFLVGSGVSFYLVNPLPSLINKFKEMNIFKEMNSFKEMFSSALQFIDQLLPALNGYASIIVMAVLILIVVQILDKKILKT